VFLIPAVILTMQLLTPRAFRSTERTA